MDNNNVTLIMAALFAVSEALGAIPQVKANGVFQTIYGILKYIVGAKE
jgi:hypothetical protein